MHGEALANRISVHSQSISSRPAGIGSNRASAQIPRRRDMAQCHPRRARLRRRDPQSHKQKWECENFVPVGPGMVASIEL